MSRTSHEWEDLAGHFEHTNQVDLKNALPFRCVESDERLVAAEIPGVVHKDIDARRLTYDMLKSFCDLVGARDIHVQGLRTIEFDRINIPNPDSSTGSNELCRDGPANSASTTSDDGRLARKIV